MSVMQSGNTEERSQAFATLYAAHHARLYAYLRYRTGDSALAEDLAAEVFVRAWTCGDELRRPDAAIAWLFTVARNLVIDQLRRDRHLQMTVPLDRLPDGRHPRGDAPEDDVLRDERRSLVRHGLTTLGEREREIVELRFVAELRNREIARVLGLREGTVASILHRSLRRLREQLREKEEPNVGKTIRAIPERH